eukprot:Sdes_comp20241_c0_seq1m13663
MASSESDSEPKHREGFSPQEILNEIGGCVERLYPGGGVLSKEEKKLIINFVRLVSGFRKELLIPFLLTHAQFTDAKYIKIFLALSMAAIDVASLKEKDSTLRNTASFFNHSLNLLMAARTEGGIRELFEKLQTDPAVEQSFMAGHYGAEAYREFHEFDGDDSLSSSSLLNRSENPMGKLPDYPSELAQERPSRVRIYVAVVVGLFFLLRIILLFRKKASNASLPNNSALFEPNLVHESQEL